MNFHRARPLSLFVAVLLLLSACAQGPSGPVQAEIDVAAVYTQAAKTLQAQLTQSGGFAQAAAPERQASDTPAPPTEVRATATSLPTITPMFTPTRPVFFVTADETTNCRSGPGLDYEKIGSLPAGTTTQVFGTNDLHNWWMIQNPSNQFEYCWVWDETTTLDGDAYRVPFHTAPELPTATATPEIEVKVSFVGLNKCDSGKYAILRVDNPSEANLHSLEIRVLDLTKNQTLSGPDASDAPFMGTEAECPPGGDMIPAGSSGYVGGFVGTPVPHGHRLLVELELCTENGLGGACLSKQVEFTAP